MKVVTKQHWADKQFRTKPTLVFHTQSCSVVPLAESYKKGNRQHAQTGLLKVSEILCTYHRRQCCPGLRVRFSLQPYLKVSLSHSLKDDVLVDAYHLLDPILSDCWLFTNDNLVQNPCACNSKKSHAALLYHFLFFLIAAIYIESHKQKSCYKSLPQPSWIFLTYCLLI